ncbi:MAG: permease-like cell division protein FtsX [Chitinophagales bacterium]|nr:permease-like cell division protein FtsX [Chitinophagales bacterium]MDW8392986.1 permease-like cell division protein FtsX [Chitinophagales bacterium]
MQNYGRRRRFQPSYVYVVISTMLVLFTFGLLGIVFFAGHELARKLREQLEFTLILKDNVSAKEAQQLCDSLQRKPWVKEATYVSKEEAARRFTEQTGEDFSDLLDYNPLFSSVILKLHAAYTHPDSLARLEAMLQENKKISEFYYERPIITLLHRHLNNVALVLLGIALLLLVVSFSIIDSTIRLAVYASRMLIRSMQLVGATSRFIMTPFLRRGLLNGLLATALAIGLLLTLFRLVLARLPEMADVVPWTTLIIVSGSLLILGMLFSLVSTWLAVRKYLRMRVDELY